MAGIFTILSCMIFLPLFYSVFILFYRSEFKQEKYQNRKPFSGWDERIMMAAGEAALLRIWFALGRCGFENVMFQLLYLGLVLMTVLCMTDYWERVIPNKILLIGLLIYGILLCGNMIAEPERILSIAPGIILGFLFGLITFGLGYLLSKGAMGAGDVKLAILLGLILTGEYAVRVILYGSLVCAGYCLYGILKKKLTKKDQLPFVPFLYIGLIITYLIG